jgi:hypothetical protein
MFTNPDLIQASNDLLDSLSQQYEFVEAEDWQVEYKAAYDYAWRLYQTNQMCEELARSLMTMTAEEFVKWRTEVESDQILEPSE